MPFKSKAQEKLMWAKHPEIAKRWTKEHGSYKRGGIVKKTKGGKVYAKSGMYIFRVHTCRTAASCRIRQVIWTTIVFVV